jgi:hypothetical protein
VPKPCWLTDTSRSALAPATTLGPRSVARTRKVVDSDGARRLTVARPSSPVTADARSSDPSNPLSKTPTRENPTV